MSDGSKANPDGELLDHVYDGIREYDNPLPGWWKAFFILSIVFSAGYAFWFHLGGPGKSDAAVYAGELAAYEQKRIEREASDLSAVSEASLAAAAGNSDMVAKGQKLFVATCASCHQADGSGLIGPNLTDDQQKNGSTRLDIYKTISGGVPNTAMVPWAAQLAPADLVAATAFVVTLRNHPRPGKPPEGEPVGPFAAP